MSARLLTTRELALRWQVSQKAVLSWIATGRLRASRTPSGRARINASDANTYAEKHGLALFGKGARVLYVGEKLPRVLRQEVPERRMIHIEPSPYLALAQLAQIPLELVVVDASIRDVTSFVAAVRVIAAETQLAVLIGARRVKREALLTAGASVSFADGEVEELRTWFASRLNAMM